jgi:hypothetical protein
MGRRVLSIYRWEIQGIPPEKQTYKRGPAFEVDVSSEKKSTESRRYYS